MTTENTNRTRKQEIAIAALLSSPTIAEAALAVGVGEQTLWRWQQEPDFKEAFRDAKKQVLSQAITNLQCNVGEAAATLKSIMTDKESPASSRIQAARTILEYAFKGLESEEIIARLEAIEAAIGGDKP